MTAPKDVVTPCDPPVARDCRATEAESDQAATPLAPDTSQWRLYIDWRHELVVVGVGLAFLAILTVLLLVFEVMR